MSFKCIKCLRVKPTEVFTLTFSDEKICDFCRNAIEESEIKRKAEINRAFDYENKDPVFFGHGQTKNAKEVQAVRNKTFDILENIRLKKEFDSYEI